MRQPVSVQKGFFPEGGAGNANLQELFQREVESFIRMDSWLEKSEEAGDKQALTAWIDLSLIHDLSEGAHD